MNSLTHFNHQQTTKLLLSAVFPRMNNNYPFNVIQRVFPCMKPGEIESLYYKPTMFWISWESLETVSRSGQIQKYKHINRNCSFNSKYRGTELRLLFIYKLLIHRTQFFKMIGEGLTGTAQNCFFPEFWFIHYKYSKKEGYVPYTWIKVKFPVQIFENIKVLI